MGKCKNATKGGSDTQKGISPTLSSCVGEAGDVVWDLRDEVALLEEVLSQMGALPKCPFALCDVADCHQNDLYHLSIDKVTQHMKIRCAIGSQLRATLGEGGGDQPPPPHAWTSLLIADMFQDGLGEQITQAVVLAPREAFFFWMMIAQKGAPS